jgi:hypothetical protein
MKDTERHNDFIYWDAKCRQSGIDQCDGKQNGGRCQVKGATVSLNKKWYEVCWGSDSGIESAKIFQRTGKINSHP